LYLYRQAFVFFNVGYASAIAWVLLMVIMLFTGAQFYFARFWVFYDGETRR
jgi:multiple sugar transport system permease protein